MNLTNNANTPTYVPPQNMGPGGIPPENAPFPYIPLPETPSTKKNRKTRMISIILGIMFILGVGAYGVFAYTQQRWPFTPQSLQSSEPENQNTQTQSNTNSTSPNNETNTSSTEVQGIFTRIFNIVFNQDDNKNTGATQTNETLSQTTNANQNTAPEQINSNTQATTETNITQPTPTESTNTTTEPPIESTNTAAPTEAPLANDGDLTNAELDMLSANYKNSQKVSSLGFGFNITMDAKGLARANLKLDGTGKIEQEEFLYPDSEFDVSYNLNANGVTAQGGGEEKTVDGIAYLKIDGMQTNVTAINNFISTAKGITGTSISGKWLKIVYEEIAEYYEDEAMPDLSQAKEALNEYWILYTALGTLEEAEYIGAETINGVTTDHYRTVINQEEMQAALNQASDLVYNPQMIALMEIFEYVLAHTQDIPVEIWIGKDNFIYQLDTTIQYYDPSVGNDMTFHIKANVFDYNEPVTITPPDSAIMASQAIAKLHELMFTLLGTYSGDVPKLQGIIQIFL
ncbi:MAG: hypothetical protein A3B74_03680 [Candidatus Kerfeldbacteria bacterium RIFCSPHIGHO2_02_FULL_42_14]|uniref:Uncharacterized protein n=1 Tax=Candidatus Kerfeldbacteria bacterium RIFCSPHIGHO2_02_FULL_42_14 TaxID=1798540 RepID=A0A1G2APY4_9BACT|nr:MAG: hypothetical protein A3B74_03680 [Candidatus Kerfeldbacteria bacterium RIFCSPHIGHO2_02_FULL_42_14]OGY80618.1 MAG: hypothetical protein A3E60_04180 [Candidatus Kerfeldbacteria bacterium RIFCSPHIGHO2_12_FULL_42_13]OGY82542.1 MAG: hypothetical protein A3I91_03840 [Candidatus Kerfeldbacteria bacterium RIFCSPLOWO2_02_FULL_42_19]OGY85146.1 MAG: hypothetical protein A3G01_00970 [Candidatus Kerfeldbacteria bacterium RIFCSPLOWO2_12_FULL_43_9]